MSESTSLLRDDEPGPVRVLREAAASDFLLTADHAAAPFRAGWGSSDCRIMNWIDISPGISASPA